MKKFIIAGLCSVLAAGLTSCDGVFTPEPENHLPLDYIEVNANYAEGLVGSMFILLPSSVPFNEPATDDAVSNDPNNSWRRMAGGSWTASDNPMGRWDNCRHGIQYCNILLEHVDNIDWASNEGANRYFRDRFKGEAYGLRAIFTYYLLQSHGGFDAAGQLLGIPIVEVVEGEGTNFNVPRNTFEECVKAMRADAAKAIELLPTEYGPNCYSEMRGKYPEITDGNLSRVYGDKFCGRISGRIVEAYLARMDLLAASPAFSQSGVTWEEAANSNAKVIARNGGIGGLDPTGGTWYCDPAMEDLTLGNCPPEIMWRTNKGENNSLEKDHFPPTLYGNGLMNPTQNLVDAFPMANGYPIGNPASGYDANNPYADRDPRLDLYILHNGSTAGTANAVINTSADSDTNDGLNKISTSTRTGYYMKKHLRQDVSCDPNSSTNKFHYTARLRFTEFYLNYAEAANEAWGPLGSGSNGFSAYDVIKEIRLRAGIGLENGDAYLESIKNDKDKMRELIRNERRLELCFEGFRFYDLRRWNSDVATLNTEAKGISFTAGVPQVISVETRNYKDYMIYGPIPYSEILKFSALQQNAGW